MASKYDRQIIAKKLVGFIRDEHNYRNINLSREDVAEAIGISKSTLTAVVHNEMQTTFTELVNKYRAYHAHRLLKSEKNAMVPLDEIAIRSGFSNRMTMHRAFIKVYGMAPGEVKREVFGCRL